MFAVKLVTVLTLLLAAAVPAATADSPLPPMSYYSSLDSDGLRDTVRSNPAFANLEPELFGSPLRLRITHSFNMTAGGTATSLVSAIFTGGTLGLIPAVSNNNLTVTYDVLVHNAPVASWTYQRNLTRVTNIWAKDMTQGLGEEGLAWLRETGTQFAAAAVQDPRILELKREYEFYFGAPATPAAATPVTSSGLARVEHGTPKLLAKAVSPGPWVAP